MFLRLDNFTTYVGSLVGIASGQGRASGEEGVWSLGHSLPSQASGGRWSGRIPSCQTGCLYPAAVGGPGLGPGEGRLSGAPPRSWPPFPIVPAVPSQAPDGREKG